LSKVFQEGISKVVRRKRYFPYWKGESTNKSLLGDIRRASMNAPIQGLAADMTKIAMIRLRNYLNKNNLRGLVKPFAQVHDQIDFDCDNSVAEEWANILKREMEEAAFICLNNRLLKTAVQISDLWQK
jgi:DNA polymerase-1